MKHGEQESHQLVDSVNWNACIRIARKGECAKIIENFGQRGVQVSDQPQKSHGEYAVACLLCCDE